MTDVVLDMHSCFEDVVIRDDIFDFIYQMALSDATRRVPTEYNCRQLFEDNESEVISIVKNYAESTINGNNSSLLMSEIAITYYISVL